jgi:hypothetical protein
MSVTFLGNPNAGNSALEQPVSINPIAPSANGANGGAKPKALRLMARLGMGIAQG